VLHLIPFYGHEQENDVMAPTAAHMISPVKYKVIKKMVSLDYQACQKNIT
jgi:hypothetical protein